MRISDWSSDVCSSDLIDLRELPRSLRLRERCDGRLALRAKKADPLALRVARRARRRDPGFGTRAASVALVDLRLADRAAVNQRLTPVAGLARQHQVGSGGAALRRCMPQKDMLKRDVFGAVCHSSARRLKL